MANVRGQEARILLLEAIGDGGGNDFGGAWFDAVTGTEHLATTAADQSASYLELATAFGVASVVHVVEFSAEELRVLSSSVGLGDDPILGAFGYEQSAVDFSQNAVLVAVSQTVYDLLGGASFVGSHPAIQLVGDPIVVEPDVCSSRFSCGAPLRGGVVIDEVARSSRCSLAFTSSATDGSRWAITAGHCATTLNSLWRHGEQTIGPVRATFNEAEVDVARIHMNRSYWLQSGGGYLYDYYTPNVPANLHYAIQNRTTIQVDDVVCLNAQHSTPTYTCGLITRTYGSRNMPQTDFDACGGDSGGAWVYRPGGGQNWGYGVHSGSSPDTCHAAFGYSIFTSIPDMDIVFDATAAARIRVEYRP